MIFNTSSKSSHRQPIGSARMLLTDRDVRVLLLAYRCRAVTRAAVTRRLFSPLASRPGQWESSIVTRRLGLLTAHGFLAARALPVQQVTGRPHRVYSCGEQAVHIVAQTLDLDPVVVARRVRQDARLSFTTWLHRAALTEIRLSFELACEQRGYELVWRSDEELAAEQLTVTRSGRALRLRPDAFLVVSMRTPEGRVRHYPCCLEYQQSSSASAFADKLTLYGAGLASPTLHQQLGFAAFRLLAVAATSVRALHLHGAAEKAGLPPGFCWSAPLPRVVAEPLGAVWWVSGQHEDERHALLG